jgi:hypothetical protein
MIFESARKPPPDPFAVQGKSKSLEASRPATDCRVAKCQIVFGSGPSHEARKRLECLCLAAGEFVQINFAMLSILAARADGCATFRELERETKARARDKVDHFSEVDVIDVLQLGLAVIEGDRLRITDVGRSALRGMVDLNTPHENPPRSDAARSLKSIDDLVGTEEHRKILNLGLRPADGALVQEPGEIPSAEAFTPTESTNDDPAMVGNLSHGQGDHRRPAPAAPVVRPPAFLTRDFGLHENPLTRTERRKPIQSASIAY